MSSEKMKDFTDGQEEPLPSSKRMNQQFIQQYEMMQKFYSICNIRVTTNCLKMKAICSVCELASNQKLLSNINFLYKNDLFSTLFVLLVYYPQDTCSYALINIDLNWNDAHFVKNSVKVI